jgi:fatty-acyl-CoA synthase
MSIGEIAAKSFGIMRRYFDNKPATKAAFATDGWLSTGDLGSIDELGYLHIQGRLKDMIIRGDANVFLVRLKTCSSRPGLPTDRT